MDASKIPKGQAPERYTDGRPVNLPGVYQHKDTGSKFITAGGEHGVVQADALMSPVWKDAWERVGDIPTRVEVLAMNKAQLVKDTAAEATQQAADEAELKEALIKAGVTEAKASETAKRETTKAKVAVK